MNEVQVLVLAGGRGTRLSTVVNDVPKPMAPVSGKPFLEYVLKYLEGFELYDVCFLTGHKAEVIREFSKKYEESLFNLTESYEGMPLGTGGAIKKAISLFPDKKRFLVLNGDTFFKVDLNEFLQVIEAGHLLALKKIEDCSRYGRVIVEDLTINSFLEKNESNRDPGLINGGVYLLDASIEKDINDGFVSLESDVFPNLISKKELFGIESEGNFLDIGIPQDFEKAQKLIPAWV